MIGHAVERTIAEYGYQLDAYEIARIVKNEHGCPYALHEIIALSPDLQMILRQMRPLAPRSIDGSIPA